MDDDIKYGEVLGPEVKARETKVKRGFWRTLRRAAGQVPFAPDLVAAYYCAIDRQTPVRVRAVLLGALAYFVLPMDAIPDFIAGVGFTDDVTVLLGAVSIVRAHILPRHREAASRALDGVTGADA